MRKSPAQTYLDKGKIDLDQFRQKLKLKKLEARNKFIEGFPHAHQFLLSKGLDLDKIREHSAKLLTAGALTTSLLLSPPKDIKPLGPGIEISQEKNAEEGSISKEERLKAILKSLLPEKPRALSRDEERKLEQAFEKIIGVKARGTLEGEHLNTTYGYIGAEQHLRRYPGDTLEQHGSGKMLKEGIAPGLGAWGYFAPNKAALNKDLEETEKWYAVVQTLYLPDWSQRQPYLRDWYKYRKVLIVNTLNGKAVVASIADSGPAAWTGKHFGGSPEVMEYLGGWRYKKGPVILFFIDDPENKVPLGPVDYDKMDSSAKLVQI